MIELIKLIVITSLLILGYTIASQPNMLLHKIRLWAEKKNKVIYEATLLCVWCMSSTWSLLGFGFGYLTGLSSFTWHSIFLYPIVVAGASLLSGFTWSLYQMIETIKDKNEMEIERFYEEDLAYDSETNIYENQHN